MSWHFSRALVAAYSEESSSDGRLCALLKSMPTARLFYSHGKTTATSLSFQSGMTCERLTAFHGEELLSWFRSVFLARESAQLAPARDYPTFAADSGLKESESLARYSPSTCSWKTPLCSPAEESTLFSGIWPRWGTMRNGVCWVQQIPLGVKATRSRITNAIESGFVRYPTPRANDAQKRGNFDAANPRNGLAGFVRRYPTPCATDSTKWNNMTAGERKAKGQAIRLPNALRTQLNVSVGGKQNPEFTEWLMGWPIGWSDLRPLAMARFQQWLDSHGKLSTPEHSTSAAPAGDAGTGKGEFIS